MNKISIFLCLLLSTSSLLVAQGDATSPQKKAISKSKDRLVLGFSHDNWLNTPDSVKTKWYNRGFSVHIMYDIPILESKHFSIAPGFGLTNNNIYTDAQLQSDSTGSFFTPYADGVDYDRNKLTTTFLEIPVELRFRTKPNEKTNKSFKIGIGVKGGYLIDAHTKYRGDNVYLTQREDSKTIKFKEDFLPNIAKYRLSSSFRVGYGNFNVFANYSLTTLFDKDKGPDINPISVGITFNSF